MWQLATILAVYSREGFPGGSVVKNLPDNAGDAGSVPGWGRASGKEMQLTPVFLFWEIPKTEEAGGLQSMGLQKSQDTT